MDKLKFVYVSEMQPVVHGRWVEIPGRLRHYQCSECGVVWGVSSKAMRYCPNCAAKMDGRESE